MSAPYPTFTWEPDFGQAMTETDLRPQDMADLGPAQRFMLFPTRREDTVMACTFLGTSRQEIAAVKEFFRDRCGRARPFMMPSWRPDLSLAAAASESDPFITVAAADFETRLQQRLDGEGHFVFLWAPGETVVVDRVVRLVEAADGTETIELADGVPFDLDPETAIVGFGRIARFLDDRLSWTHKSADVAEAEVKMRFLRAAYGDEAENPCTQIDQYGQLGFISQIKTPENPATTNLRVAYALGPYLFHEGQDWLYDRRWAAYPGTTHVRVRKLPTGTTTQDLPADVGFACGLFEAGEALDSDHYALAFDQNSYEVVAWQKDAETIELRRWTNDEVDTREWDGQDPVLVYNGLLDPNQETEETDVVCYYLKPADNRLFSRYQRDDFEVERVAAYLTFTPLELRGTRFEDTTLFVEALDTSLRKVELESAPYPEPPEPIPPPWVDTYATDSGSAGLVILDGSYGPAVVWADGLALEDPHEPFADGATTGTSILATYFSTVVWSDGLDLEDPHEPIADMASAGTSITSVYTAVVIDGGDHADSATAGLSATSVYAHVVIAPTGELDDSASLSLSHTAVYEPA